MFFTRCFHTATDRELGQCKGDRVRSGEAKVPASCVSPLSLFICHAASLCLATVVKNCSREKNSLVWARIRVVQGVAAVMQWEIAIAVSVLLAGTVTGEIAPLPSQLAASALLKTGGWASVNVSDLIRSVQERLQCAPTGLTDLECIECLSTGRLLDLVPAGATQNSPQLFEQLSVVLLYHLANLKGACKEPSKCSTYVQCRTSLMELVHHNDENAVLLKFEDILRNVKEVYKPGYKLQCFTAESVLDDASRYKKNKNQFVENLSGTVITHLIDGKCIEVGGAVTDFLEDLFQRFGDRNSEMMSQTGLERLMKKLKVNAKNIPHGSSGHSHDHDHGHSQEHDHDHSHDHSHDHDQDHSHDHDHGNDHSHDQGDDHDHDSNQHLNGSHAIHDHNNHSHDSTHGYLTGDDHSEHDNSQNRTEHESGGHTDHGHINARPTLPSGQDDSTQDEEGKNRRANDGPMIEHQPREGHIDHDHQNKDFKEKGTHHSTEGASHHISRSTTDHVRSPNEELATTTPLPVYNTKEGGLTAHHTPGKDQHHYEAHQLPPSSLDTQKTRRSAPDLDTTPNDHHDHSSSAAKCWTTPELISKFSQTTNNSISKQEFLRLCPALVQQAVTDVCKHTHGKSSSMPTTAELYGYGTLAVFIITMCSLVGILLLPCMARSIYHYIMMAFIGLSIGAMAGDALLHLIPQVLGIHNHGGESHGDHDHHHHDEEDALVDPYFYKELGLLGVIYFLFLFESISALITGKDTDEHHVGHTHMHGSIPEELRMNKVGQKTESRNELAQYGSSGSLEHGAASLQSDPFFKSSKLCCGMSTLATVIILGGAIHNFADGLAIGASFTSSVKDGLSTSIAVFCHELPHEFGDFVVLISTGLGYKRALFLNLMSGLAAFGGLYAGFQVGDDAAARNWILAVTAGVFLYVSLVDMLPELKNYRGESPVKMFICKNIGLIVGVAFMCVIAIYEDRMEF